MVGSAEAVIWAAVVEFGSRVGPGCVKAVLVLSEWASGRETRAAPQTPRSGKHRKLLSGLRAFAPSPFHRIAPSLTWPPPDRSFVTTSFVHEKKPSGKPSSGKPHQPWVRALPWPTSARRLRSAERRRGGMRRSRCRRRCGDDSSESTDHHRKSPQTG